MAEFKNCRLCGKLFTSMAYENICYNCRVMEEKEFDSVKEYLYENPGATITEIVNELNISVTKIKRYLKEGRLEILGDEGNFILECERCGKSIKTGRFCNECQREINMDLQDTAEKLKSTINIQTDNRDSIKYRYMDGKKK